MAFDPSVYPRTLTACVSYVAHSSRPRVLAAAAGLGWTARIAWGDPSPWDAVVLAVLLAWWPLQEWLIHVHVLHFRPRKTRGGRVVDLAIARQHRRHHEDPLRLEILFIPWPALLGGIVFHVVAWPLLLPAPQALTTIAAYLTLTLHYEWVHFLCHTPYVPRSRIYRARWRNHRLHHFKNEHYWMGVSMLLGDRILGTSPARDAVRTSTTCRTLGIEEALAAEHRSV
jgi:hypothetical protein